MNHTGTYGAPTPSVNHTRMVHMNHTHELHHLYGLIFCIVYVWCIFTIHCRKTMSIVQMNHTQTYGAYTPFVYHTRMVQINHTQALMQLYGSVFCIIHVWCKCTIHTRIVHMNHTMWYGAYAPCVNHTCMVQVNHTPALDQLYGSMFCMVHVWCICTIHNCK